MIRLNNLIFLEHRRTGSTAIRQAMLDMGGVPGRRHTYEKVEGCKYFCVVRNPYDVLVSWYLVTYGKTHKMEFTHWLRHYKDTSMTVGGRLFFFVDYCHHILRYEDIGNDLHRLIPGIKLKMINVTEGKGDYRSYYSDEDTKFVRERYSQDIREFRYCLQF